MNLQIKKEKTEEQPKVIEKIIIQEKTDLKKEAELLEKLAHIEKQNELLKQRIEENQKEFKDFTEIKKEPIQIEIIEEKHNAKNEPEKNNKRKIYFLSGAALIILSSLIIWFFNSSKKEIADINLAPKHGDTIYVAVNKIQILQDNPGMEFKIEEFIQSEIERKTNPLKLPVIIITTDFKNVDLTNDTSVISFARKKNAYWKIF